MGTVKVTINSTSWTEVGAGPLYVEAPSDLLNGVYLSFGSTAPTLNTEAYHRLHRGGPYFSYGGTEKCFARSAHGDAFVIATGGI